MNRKMLFTLFAIVTPLFASFAITSNASAVSGSDFKAGNIINDAVFFNPNTMAESDIQAFLNSKVPTCDTNGSGQSTHYDSANRRYYTRAEWGSLNGSPAPYTCLRNYSQSVSSIAADSYCRAIEGGNLTASKIIYRVSQACSISPKAMIVLLQKEQGLITDEWPWERQYRAATGFGCPDTAACDQQYSGLFNQLYRAARQFQLYKRNPTNYSYRPNGSFYIAWNPNANCGGSSVYLQNQATAGLYNYTPYQPNAAALANLNGTGDSCSAYGNRNFWVFYNNWFGSTQASLPYAWNIVSENYYSDSSRTRPYNIGKVSLMAGQKAYVRIKVQNVGNQTWNQSTVRLGTANRYDRSSIFKDSSWIDSTRIGLVESSVAPGNTGTFEFSMTAPSATGTYREFFNMVAENITWMPDPGMYATIDITTTQPNLGVKNTLTSGEVLPAPQNLLSPEGHQALHMENSGNLVLYKDDRVVWTSGTASVNGARLTMQGDGNLVIYNGSNGALWASGTDGNPGARLVIQSDGNLVIYNTANQAVWATDITSTPALSDYVTTNISVGTLFRDQRLRTANGNNTLVFQGDGNLVLYRGNRAVWASNTDGKGATRLVFQGDGNLVLYNGSNRAVWASNTDGKGANNLVLQEDGNLVLYTRNSGAAWATNTSY